MRKLFIAGNWKMHGSKEKVGHLLSQLIACTHKTSIDWAVFPPFVYLSQCEALLKGSPMSPIYLGAQNICQYAQEGPYTGEICGSMLREFGCRYVLVGHSERRSIYGESNFVVAEKFKAAVSAGLHPILCVGETLEERSAEKTWAVIAEQMRVVLQSSPTAEMWQNATIAYEPVWAIGTGHQASPEEAQTVHAAIRSCIKDFSAPLADSLRILYGGSVKANNAAAILAMPDVDGALVGGASLNAEEFLKIGHSL